MTEPYKILLIDDHPLMRKGMRQILELETDFVVVGEASNGSEGVAQALKLQPDLIMLDLNMKGISGLDTLRSLRAHDVNARVVVLTVSDDQSDILALMDAGVPIKAAVAGIAMGLVKEEEKFVVLSDILGDEDHLGDMDFKVAGTREGVTALQMDIKIEGITPEIMQIALNQAKGARMHILGVMEQAIPAPRADISDYAPRIHTMKIDPKKIKDVIGKGGATIRALTEETGTSIDIDDDGTVKIAATDNNAAKAVMARIEEIVAEVEVNAVYKGKVTRVVDFGAFVSILGGKEGLVHISQITDERVERVADYISVGQEVMVKVVEIDRQNRIRLTMKDVNNAEAEVATPVEEQAE